MAHENSVASSEKLDVEPSIDKLKELLALKQREIEDMSFSVNLLETETAYRVQVAEREKEKKVSAAETSLNFKEQQLSRSEHARKKLEASVQKMGKENERLRALLKLKSNNVHGLKRKRNEQSVKSTNGSHTRLSSSTKESDSSDADSKQTGNFLSQWEGSLLCTSSLTSVEEEGMDVNHLPDSSHIDSTANTQVFNRSFFAPLTAIFAETSADLLVLLGVAHLVRNTGNAEEQLKVLPHNEGKGRPYSIVKTPAAEHQNASFLMARSVNSAKTRDSNDDKTDKSNNGAINSISFTPSIMKPSPFSILHSYGSRFRKDDGLAVEQYMTNLSFQLYTQLTRVIGGRATPLSIIPKILPFLDGNNTSVEYHSAALGVLFRLLSTANLGNIQSSSNAQDSKHSCQKIQHNHSNKHMKKVVASKAHNDIFGAVIPANNNDNVTVDSEQSNTGSKKLEKSYITNSSNGAKGAVQPIRFRKKYKHRRIGGILLPKPFVLQYMQKNGAKGMFDITKFDSNSWACSFGPKDKSIDFNCVEATFDVILQNLSNFYNDIIQAHKVRENIAQAKSKENFGSRKILKLMETTTMGNTKFGSISFENHESNPSSLQKSNLNESHRRLERAIRIIHVIMHDCAKHVAFGFSKKITDDSIIHHILSNNVIHVRSKQLLLSIIKRLVATSPMQTNIPLLKLVQGACSLFLRLQLVKAGDSTRRLALISETLRIVSAVISCHEKVGIALLLFSPGRKMDNVFILLVNLIELLTSPMKTYEKELEQSTLTIIREGLVILTLFLTYIFGENDSLDIGEVFGKLTLDGLWLIQERILKYGSESGTICHRDILAATVQSAEAMRSLLSHD